MTDPDGGDGNGEGGEEQSGSSKANSYGRNGTLDTGGGSGGGAGGDGSSGSGGDGSGREEPEDDSPWYKGLDYGRRVVFPGLTVLILLVILIAFHKILLPFVFACALVYLMEPIVVRTSRTPEDPSGLPRWLSVIFVYLVFFGVVTLSGALIVPQFVTEVVRFAESVPQNVQKFREEKLPVINQDVRGYLEAFVPESAAEADRTQEARAHVGAAHKIATARSRAIGAAKGSVHRASNLELTWKYTEDGFRERTYRPRSPPILYGSGAFAAHGRWIHRGASGEPALRIEESGDGGMEVYLESDGVELRKTGEERWRVQTPDAAAGAGVGTGADGLHGSFDLEERLDHILEEAITFSNEQLTSVIEFAQHLVLGVLEGIIAIILTLMVAAFISIDLPRFMGFFRSLIPDELRSGYDELLTRVDTGLSGVIRGQLIICVINGVLTYVGLWLIDVKYAVLLAVIAGVLSIIPVFGAVISTIPICLIALTQGFMKSVLILAWILAIHFLEGNILNPKIIGTSAEIHPVIVIFALLAGESTYGLVGAILAVPVASILLTLFKFTRDKVWDESRGRRAAAEKEA